MNRWFHRGPKLKPCIVSCLLAVGLASCNEPLPHMRHLPTPATIAETATDEEAEAWLTGAERPPYRIQVGDLVAVRFFNESRLNDEVRVRPDGRISLTPVDDVDAAGLTPEDLDTELTVRFSEYVREPDLSVIIREFAEQRIYVGGEVTSPGVVGWTARMTALGAIMDRGGPLPSAEPSSILVLRRGRESMCYAMRLDIKQVMQTGAGDILLHPYDVIYVPRNIVSEVGLFVEQYINRIVPRAIGFQYLYDLRPEVQVDGDPRILFQRANVR